MMLLRTLCGHLLVPNLHLHPSVLPNPAQPTRTNQSLASRTILFLDKLPNVLKFLKVLKVLKFLKVLLFYHINLHTQDLQPFKLLKFLKLLKYNKVIKFNNHQQLPLRIPNWTLPSQLHFQHKVCKLLLPTLRTWTFKLWHNVWVQPWRKVWKKVWNLWQLH